MKTCTKCKKSKLKIFFGKDKQSKDKLSYSCKDCVNTTRRIYYANNKEKSSVQSKNWRLSNPEYKDKIRESRHANPEIFEKYKIQRREFYRNNREKCLLQAKEYRRNNPEKILANTRKRWARIKNAEGSYSIIEWNNLCLMFGNVCCRCEESSKLEADHVIPLTKGGNNYITNIQPLCRTCNIQKSNVTIVDYRLKHKIKSDEISVNIYES